MQTTPRRIIKQYEHIRRDHGVRTKRQLMQKLHLTAQPPSAARLTAANILFSSG